MLSPSIADLHCDLLWYLSLDAKRSAYDPTVRCSISQLQEGNVKIQTLPIFTETEAHSVKKGEHQANLFKYLPRNYPGIFHLIKREEQIAPLDRIGIIPAIENASAICSEKEDLDHALERLTALQRKIGKVLYISLTWNQENRFGGGNQTNIGLKPDGERLIDYLAMKGIAVDFSHTSDHLAYDMLNYIEKKALDLPLLASHSNLRAVTNFPRNLPDEIAKEVIKRNGVIGLNFIRYLVGQESPRFFVRHIEHLLKLGGEKNICLGADFFCIEDVPKENRKPEDLLFFPSYHHAGTYGKVIELWKKELSLSDTTIKNICLSNFIRFFKRVFFQRGE
jgi:membrane dipeptidase